MIPNLLDDLLRAWDTRAGGIEDQDPQAPASPRKAEEAQSASTVAPEEPPSTPAVEAQQEPVTFSLPSGAKVRIPAYFPAGRKPAAPLADERPIEIPISQVSRRVEFRPVEEALKESTTAPPATPMDDLLSSLLESYGQPSQPEVVAAPQADAEAEPAAPEEPEYALPPLQPSPMDNLLSSLLQSYEPPKAEAEHTATSGIEPESALSAYVPPAAFAQVHTAKHVAVGLGADRFAITVDAVLEAGRYPRTTFVPGLPEFVRGVFSFRGEVIPVIDMRGLAGLELKTNPGVESRILTVQSRRRNGKAAFVFDSLEGIVNLASEDSVPAAPADPLGAFLSGVCRSGLDRFGMIAIDRILDQAGCSDDPEAAAQ